MKVILAVAVIVGVVAAEMPSNSYLPPTTNSGYSQAPTIVAARASGHGEQYGDQGTGAGVGIARSGPQAYGDAGYTKNALDDANATGGYGEHGTPQVSSEDTEVTRSEGYDSNASNFHANNGYYGNEQDNNHGNERSISYYTSGY